MYFKPISSIAGELPNKLEYSRDESVLQLRYRVDFYGDRIIDN